MVLLIKKVAREWDMEQHENVLSGRINDIFVKLTFVKHVREKASMQKRDCTKSAEVYLFETLIQPEFDNLSVDAYVSRKEEISIPELSSFLDTQYESFRTSLPIYVNGHFEITLYQRDAVNIKAWYVIDFLNVLTDFLNEQGYFSGSKIYGGNDDPY